MNKCLKITFSAKIPEDFLHGTIQKNARKLSIEGTVQPLQEENHIRIIACGTKDNIDAFLDALHKSFSKLDVETLEIEPFLKDKDYRGVFRVIQ